MRTINTSLVGLTPPRLVGLGFAMLVGLWADNQVSGQVVRRSNGSAGREAFGGQREPFGGQGGGTALGGTRGVFPTPPAAGSPRVVYRNYSGGNGRGEDDHRHDHRGGYGGGYGGKYGHGGGYPYRRGGVNIYPNYQTNIFAPPGYAYSPALGFYPLGFGYDAFGYSGLGYSNPIFGGAGFGGAGFGGAGFGGAGFGVDPLGNVGAPPPLLAAPARQTVLIDTDVVPRPALRPAQMELVNSSARQIQVTLVDLLDPSGTQELRIPPRESIAVSVARDAGADEVRTYDTFDSFGNPITRTTKTFIRPEVRYEVVVHEWLMQSVAIDRTGKSPNVIEGANYQGKGVGRFSLPAGPLLKSGRIDVYGAARAADNAGAIPPLVPSADAPPVPAGEPERAALEAQRAAQRDR